MPIEQYILEKAREIERQKFDASQKRLRESGAIDLVTDIARFISGVEVELRDEFDKKGSESTAEIILKGPIQRERNISNGKIREEVVRAELDISTPCTDSESLNIKCAKRIVPTLSEGEIKEGPSWKIMWNNQASLEDKSLVKKRIVECVERAGFVPKEKAEEFAAKFKT